MSFADVRDQKSSDNAQLLIAEIEKSVIGKHREIVLLMTSLLAGGHVLIEDVPGVGKTTMAFSLAQAAGLSFHRAQFTPDVMASDITGFSIYNKAKETFEFREGLVMCHIFLADEINRATPKTQSSLLEAMEEGHVTVDGTTYALPQPFMVIATQNPSGYVGTFPLPEAQMDRFAIRLSMGYPTIQEEFQILASRKKGDPTLKIKPIGEEEAIRAMRASVERVTVDDAISRYIVELVQATRKHPSLAMGASPRASLSLFRLSRAYAFLHGRDYVLPEDIAALWQPTLGHRVVLSQEARMNRTSADTVLSEVLRSVSVPMKNAKHTAENE